MLQAEVQKKDGMFIIYSYVAVRRRALRDEPRRLTRVQLNSFSVFEGDDPQPFVLYSTVTVSFPLESLKRLESDYRTNLRKLQGDDREVNAYWSFGAIFS